MKMINYYQSFVELPVSWAFDETGQFSPDEFVVTEICDDVGKLIPFWLVKWFVGWAFKHDPVCCWPEPVTVDKLSDAVRLDGLNPGLIGAPGKYPE